MKLLSTLIFIHLSTLSIAQVGIGTKNPDVSSILDINSNSKGLLLPKMTIMERNNITSPANGLLIYNTNNNCVEYNQGSPLNPNWLKLAEGWGTNGNKNLNSSTNFIGTIDNTDFIIKTNNIEYFRVSSDGKIGIGTTSPSEKLEVNGAIKIGTSTNNSPSAGVIRFNTITSKFEGYDGEFWQELN